MSESGVTVKPTDVVIDVDGATLKKSLLDVAINGLGAVIGLPGASPGLGPIVDTVASTSLNQPPESQAWAFVKICFAHAIDQLRATDMTLDEVAKEAARTAFAAVDEKIRGEHYTLSRKFFQVPTSLELYQDIRSETVEMLGVMRIETKPDPLIIGAKLDAAFNGALYEILGLTTGRFHELIQKINRPGADANAMENDWQAYRAKLRHAYDVEPVFGQEHRRVSLSDLYVPLRAGWWTEGDVHISLAQAMRGGTRNVVDMETEVLTWLAERRADRRFKLIFGGPGSGKSCFAKYLAAFLSANDAYRPIFVPLQRININNDLQSEIENLLIERQKVFSKSPIGFQQADPNRPFLLIFDGLDELAAPGVEANHLASTLIRQAERLCEKLDDRGRCGAMVLITGREPIVREARRELKGLPSEDALEVLGFLPIHAAKEDAHFVRNVVVETDEFSDKDQRVLWWKRYAAATGKDEAVPVALSSDRLQSLTGEPLLCYLLAESGYATDRWEEAEENPNRVYDALLKDIYERKWGGNGAQGPTRKLDEISFYRLMEAIGLAAWRNGESRVATLSSLLEVLPALKAQSAWEDFRSGADDANDYKNLALTFYLKSDDSRGRGFEFSHRSFGEYLAARALWWGVENILEKFADEEEVALAKWGGLVGSGSINEAILNFLRNHVRLNCENVPERQAMLAHIFGVAMRDGIPVHHNFSGIWRAAEVLQRNAEESLFACLNASTMALPEDATLAQVDWGDDPFAARRMLERVQFGGGVAGVVMLMLSRLSFNGSSRELGSPSNFEGAMLVNADLTLANLTDVDLSNSVIIGADLQGANLEGTDFERANLEDVDLRGAILNRAHFERAYMSGVNLAGQNLRNTRLSGADLSAADLSNADVRGADLSNSNLAHARCLGLKIENANLCGADLRFAESFPFEQLATANGDSHCLLPIGLESPATWKQS